MRLNVFLLQEEFIISRVGEGCYQWQLYGGRRGRCPCWKLANPSSSTFSLNKSGYNKPLDAIKRANSGGNIHWKASKLEVLKTVHWARKNLAPGPCLVTVLQPTNHGAAIGCHV